MRRRKVIVLLLAVAVSSGVLMACKARSTQASMAKNVDKGVSQPSQSPRTADGSINKLIAILF